MKFSYPKSMLQRKIMCKYCFQTAFGAISNLGTAISNLGTAISKLGTAILNLGTAILNLGTVILNLGTAISNLGTANYIHYSTKLMAVNGRKKEGPEKLIPSPSLN